MPAVHLQTAGVILLHLFPQPVYIPPSCTPVLPQPPRHTTCCTLHHPFPSSQIGSIHYYSNSPYEYQHPYGTLTILLLSPLTLRFACATLVRTFHSAPLTAGREVPQYCPFPLTDICLNYYSRSRFLALLQRLVRLLWINTATQTLCRCFLFL